MHCYTLRLELKLAYRRARIQDLIQDDNFCKESSQDVFGAGNCTHCPFTRESTPVHKFLSLRRLKIYSDFFREILY